MARDEQPAGAPPHRFETMNGVRGVAALAILVWHFDWPEQTRFWNAALAVDLFFLLSGFLVAHAYEARLRAGWAAWHFVVVRAIRFWPLYLLGSAIGLAALLFAAVHGGEYWLLRSLAVYASCALLLLPQPLHMDLQAFPLNSPAWSLALEFAVNVAYAWFGFRLSNRALILIAAVSFACLMVPGIFPVSPAFDVPWRADGFWLSPPHVTFSFPLGVLLYRLRLADRLPRVRVPATALVAAVVAALFAARLGDTRESGLLVMAIAWPTIVALAACNAPSGYERKVFAVLGDISYPLYATQWGFYLFAGVLAASIGHGVAFGTAAVAALVFAPIADRFYDRPVRRRLTRLLDVRLSRANAAPPL